MPNARSQTTNDLRELLRLAFVEKKYSQSQPGLQLLADQGNVGAAIALAQIFLTGGDGVGKDYSAAKRWLELVVSQVDSPHAFHHLGIIHIRGLGTPSDHATAYRYFRRAAVQGYALSLFMAGTMQADSDGVVHKERSGRTIIRGCIKDRRLGLYRRFLAVLCLLTPKWK